jgi:hypothetical protein
MKIKNNFFILCLSFLSFVVFKQIIFNSLISGGDYIQISPGIGNFLISYPFTIWNSNIQLGLSALPTLHYAPYNLFIGIISTVITTSLLEKLVWWIPFLLIGLLSSSLLFRYFYRDSKYWLVSALIYIFNTYIFMVISGGQIAGIGLAYALSPFVLYIFFKLIDSVIQRVNFKRKMALSIIASICLSILLTFDIRTTYIVMLVIFLYIVFSIQAVFIKRTASILFFTLLIPGFITLLLHIFWLLPLLMYRFNPAAQLGQIYTSTGAANFFSFANFENTFSLLHPNWPENIFGKVGFMKPEFILIPILAYGSLIFLKNSKSETHNDLAIEQLNNRTVLFFALIGLIGAFLAKGTNPPFGELYLWMFNHLPGFIMFRDSTKWYVLVAISYSILIPFSISSIYKWLSSKFKNSALLRSGRENYIPDLFILLVVSYLIFLIRPALMGQLTGTFANHIYPKEYVNLNNYLNHDKNFYRILWIPSIQRFTDLSTIHPAVSAELIFNVNSVRKIIGILNKPTSKYLLQEMAVKYVIVPYDSEGEIFLKNRKYDDSAYQKTITSLKKIKWLTYKQNYGKIIIFEVLSPKDHFWLANSNEKIDWKMIKPIHYQITAKNATISGLVVFSEGYDPNWVALSNGAEVHSKKYNSYFNSFALNGNATAIDIYYQPQRWVDIGLVISGISALAVVIILIVLIIEYRV